MQENNKQTAVSVVKKDETMQASILERTVIGTNSQKLIDILTENIERVQKDKDYVPQAKEIRDNVREIVNIARVEADVLREVRKANH